MATESKDLVSLRAGIYAREAQAAAEAEGAPVDAEPRWKPARMGACRLCGQRSWIPEGQHLGECCLNGENE